VPDSCSRLLSLVRQADTPYAGGRFSANVDIPPEYPFRAPTKVRVAPWHPCLRQSIVLTVALSPRPKVVFTTQIYHPNVDKDGNVCLQAFTENWSPQKKMAECTPIRLLAVVLRPSVLRALSLTDSRARPRSALLLAASTSVLEDVRQMIFVNAHLETPLRATIAEEYKNNKAKFDATAAKWTKKYAM